MGHSETCQQVQTDHPRGHRYKGPQPSHTQKTFQSNLTNKARNNPKLKLTQSCIFGKLHVLAQLLIFDSSIQF